MRRSICIISLAPIQRDARVLRQVEYLSRDYDLTVIARGRPELKREALPGVVWRTLGGDWAAAGERRLRERVKRLSSSVIPHLPADIRLSLLMRAYWAGSAGEALRLARAAPCDAYHANDWNALPVAAEAAREQGARLVFDAHEYAPLEWEDDPVWMAIHAPLITAMLRRYAPHVDVSTTVVAQIADRYRDEFALDPLVVMNAPKLVPIEGHPLDPHHIHVVHHGLAIRGRRLDPLIETLSHCDRRFSLHLMLVGSDDGYVRYLKHLAEGRAPGRVTFHDPVRPEEIVTAIAKYDVGAFILEPTNFNYRMALPNKLFDFIAARLAVCVGPSPAMADLVRRHGCGVVAPTFNPEDVARVLNALSTDDLLAMREASGRASSVLNADVEMGKLLDLYARLFQGDLTQCAG